MKVKKEEAAINARTCIDILWQEIFFKDSRRLKDVSEHITDKWDHNFSTADISKALQASSFLRRTGTRGKYQYIQKISPVSKKVANIEDELFSDQLVKKLYQDFKIELDDLRLNFGNSGNCTSFLLRKILEKLIYLVFVRNGLGPKIEDPGKPGNLVGLKKMLNIASQEKINGVPILTPATTTQIQGIKFLGDTSAHNPLVNVDMETIIPQMPFIITAYKELAERLNKVN